MSTLRHAEKRVGAKKTREKKREENRPPDPVGINSDRSLQKLYGFDCWDWGILMMTSLGLARPSSSRAMDSILWDRFEGFNFVGEFGVFFGEAVDVGLHAFDI